jgi:hypothetical protein
VCQRVVILALQVSSDRAVGNIRRRAVLIDGEDTADRVAVALKSGSVASDRKVAAELAPLMTLPLLIRPVCGSSFH